MSAWKKLGGRWSVSRVFLLSSQNQGGWQSVREVRVRTGVVRLNMVDLLASFSARRCWYEETRWSPGFHLEFFPSLHDFSQRCCFHMSVCSPWYGTEAKPGTCTLTIAPSDPATAAQPQEAGPGSHELVFAFNGPIASLNGKGRQVGDQGGCQQSS